jgi:hypothetical protein
MRSIRLDLPALHEYTEAVAEAAQDWLSSLTPEDLDRTVETPFGERKLAEAVEVLVEWHINAHCGEIASLKGCLGAQGYGF